MISQEAKDTIEEFVQSDDLDGAVELFRANVDRASDQEIAKELVIQIARLTRMRNEVRRGLMTVDEERREVTRLGFAVLELLAKIPVGNVPTYGLPSRGTTAVPRAVNASTELTAFISYNHADRPIALRLKEALEAGGVAVRIDSDSMGAGESIRGFINRAIQETNVTVCVISSASLVSAWVGTETLSTLRHETFDDSKRFLAGYLDDSFFKPGFRLEATKRIDARIGELDALIPDYQAAKLDTNDINDERTRLHDLRHGLGEILRRLRDSLCLDLRDSAFQTSVDSITRTILGAES